MNLVAFKIALLRAKCVARKAMQRAVQILMDAGIRFVDACILANSFSRA